MRLAGTAEAVLLVTMSVGCSTGATQTTPGSAVVATTSPFTQPAGDSTAPTSAEEPLLTIPSQPGQPLPAGRYAPDVFATPLSFGLGEGWILDRPELVHALLLAREDAEVFLTLALPSAIFGVQEDGDHGPPLPVPQDPEELAQHLTHPGILESTTPEQLMVHGRRAIAVDLAASDLGDMEEPSVLLFSFPADPLEREPFSVRLVDDTKARVVVIENGAEPVVLMLDAPNGLFDEHASAIDGVITTMKFGERASGQ